MFLSAWFLRHFNSARIIYCREYTNTLTPAPMDSARHRSQATGPHTRLVTITFANVFPDENKPIDCWLRGNVMKTRFSLEEITIFNKFLYDNVHERNAQMNKELTVLSREALDTDFAGYPAICFTKSKLFSEKNISLQIQFSRKNTDICSS